MKRGDGAAAGTRLTGRGARLGWCPGLCEDRSAAAATGRAHLDMRSNSTQGNPAKSPVLQNLIGVNAMKTD
jgi:hypothetical protein